MTELQPLVNEEIVKRFSALLSGQRLAHAYLFIGPKDVGKSETALGVAKLVNCESPVDGLFCGRCPSCLKIEHGNHADIHIIAGLDGEAIKIEQIRALIERIQLRPFEARKKVFIVKNVEDLTLEAGNALLKTLEEPSANSLLLLTASAAEKILDTIKSRCHQVRFFPLSNAELARELVKDYAIGEIPAHFLANFSEGCLGKARKLGEGKAFDRKNRMVDQLVLSPDSDAYIKEVLADKEATRELLEVLFSWFRDLVLLKIGADEARLIHLDRLRDLRRAETQYSFTELKEIVEEIVKARQLLSDNLNIKIPLTLIRERLWRK